MSEPVRLAPGAPPAGTAAMGGTAVAPSPAADFALAADLSSLRLPPQAALDAISVGTLLGRIFRVYVANLGRFLALSAALSGLHTAVVLYAVFHRDAFTVAYSKYDPFVALVVVVAIWGAIIVATVRTLAGSQPGFGECLAAAFTRLLPSLGLLLIFVLGFAFPAGLLTGLGANPAAATGVLLLPMLVIGSGWAVSVPVSVIEKPGVFASLARSWRLTRGYRAKVFWSFFVLCLLALGLFTLVTVAFGQRWGVLQAASPAFVFAVIVLRLVFWTFFATSQAVVYHELRAAKEGSNPAELAAVFA